MKTDDGDLSPRKEAVGRPPQKAFERTELVVYRDPQRLECAGGRVDPLTVAAGRGRDDPAADLGQLGGFTDRFGLTSPDNFPRDTPTEPLFAIAEDDFGDLFGTPARQKLPGGFPFGYIEPQIKVAVGVETESACSVGELIAGKTEIQKKAVHLFDPEHFQDGGKVGVVCLRHSNGSPIRGRLAGKARFNTVERRGILVDRNHQTCRSDAVGDRQRMSPASQCAVHINAPGFRSEHVKNLLKEDWPMDGPVRSQVGFLNGLLVGHWGQEKWVNHPGASAAETPLRGRDYSFPTFSSRSIW